MCARPLTARTRIPLARPTFGTAERDAVAAVLESGWVVQGPRVAEFEQSFRACTGGDNAIGGVAPIERAPVKVGRRTYLGASTVVAKGVVIDDHVVIGANSFVNRDVPDFAIAVGSPCRIIGHVKLAEDGTVELQYT